MKIHSNKLLAVLLAVSVALNAAVVCSILFGANAAPTYTLNVSSANAYAGKTVDVTVSIPENPGVALVGFDVNYDSKNLTLNSISAGNIFTDTEMDGNVEKVPFMFTAYTGKNDKTASGTLVTLNFTVSANAPAAVYDIKLEKIEVMNIAEDTLSFTAVNGKITVADSQSTDTDIPGDLNADGKVTMADLRLLARYLAGADVELK